MSNCFWRNHQHFDPQVSLLVCASRGLHCDSAGCRDLSARVETMVLLLMGCGAFSKLVNSSDLLCFLSGDVGFLTSHSICEAE